MSIFDRFFARRQISAVRLVSETGNGFYSWNGKLYESDVVRAAIRPFVLAVGKLVGKEIYETTDERGRRKIEVNPDAYVRFLLEEPNPYMTGQVLQERLAAQLALNRNAFALILRDEAGLPQSILPINAVGVTARFSPDGELLHEFQLANGKTFTFPDADVIHLKTDVYQDDVYGSPIGPSITSLMEIVTTTDQGIVKAIKNSAVIRWLLKYTKTLRPEDLKKNSEEFAKQFLSTEAATGVAATDASADAKQIEGKEYVPNAAQMDRTTQRILSLLNTSQRIVDSTRTETEWNSYFDAQIEPVLRYLQNEYTRKLFTRRQRAFGKRIVFEANAWDSAAIATKLALVSMVDRGALTPNEWRATFNLAPLPGGDNPIRRLDTAMVADYVQIVPEESGDGEPDGGKDE